jgi:hypothetical protein
VSKSKKKLFFINHLFKKKNGAAKILLWKTMVLPLMEYACTVWNPIEKGLQMDIEKIQYHFLDSIRLSAAVNGYKQFDETLYKDRLKEIGFQTLWERRLIAIMSFGAKLVKNIYPHAEELFNVKTSDPKGLPPRTRAQTQTATGIHILITLPSHLDKVKALNTTKGSFASTCVSMFGEKHVNDLLKGNINSFKFGLRSCKLSEVAWSKKHISSNLLWR